VDGVTLLYVPRLLSLLVFYLIGGNRGRIMQKYTDEHLKGIDPMSILGFELSIKRLKRGVNKLSVETCPAYLSWFTLYIDNCNHCSEILIYDRPKDLESWYSPCPCRVFGRSKSIEIMQNLVTQWREWAQLTPED
jgi:hypothetical protein